MKRLRKVIHLALVWTSICLMSADPAAACRLLANRRCCTCCCPTTCCSTTPAPCDEKSPVQSPNSEKLTPEKAGSEASPSDQPRTTKILDVPPGLPVTSAPTASDLPLSPTANVIREPSHVPSSTHPVAGNRAAPDSQPNTATGVIEIERTKSSSLDTPTSTVTSPTTADNERRQPVDVVPPPTTAVNPPAAIEPATVAADPFAPLPTTPTLAPRQSFTAPGVTAPTAATPDREPSVTANEPANRPTGKDDSPLTANDEPTINKSDKPLAAPTVAQPAKPVATPDFPAVSDDPFAPIAAPSPVTPKLEDHSDDPFAPLPAAPAAPEKPEAPLVVEPTHKKIDLLAPGSDGRLPSRQWTDNSGKFNVKAKLVLILDGKVRLLKETGRTTTVAIDRLSKADQAYVAEAIQRYGEDLAKLHQLASR